MDSSEVKQSQENPKDINSSDVNENDDKVGDHPPLSFSSELIAQFDLYRERLHNGNSSLDKMEFGKGSGLWTNASEITTTYAGERNWPATSPPRMADEGGQHSKRNSTRSYNFSTSSGGDQQSRKNRSKFFSMRGIGAIVGLNGAAAPSKCNENGNSKNDNDDLERSENPQQKHAPSLFPWRLSKDGTLSRVKKLRQSIVNGFHSDNARDNPKQRRDSLLSFGDKPPHGLNSYASRSAVSLHHIPFGNGAPSANFSQTDSMRQPDVHVQETFGPDLPAPIPLDRADTWDQGSSGSYHQFPLTAPSNGRSQSSTSSHLKKSWKSWIPVVACASQSNP